MFSKNDKSQSPLKELKNTRSEKIKILKSDIEEYTNYL